jgi:dipeptidyl aminopeptidase/acylaminoacyl peptidase
MRKHTRAAAFLVQVLALVWVASLGARDQSAGKRAIELQDIINWKSPNATAFANDGQWLAYRLSPGEGDSEVIVRQTRGDKEMKFGVGETSGGGGGGGRGGGAPAGPAGAALAFSDDSKWLAFTIAPTRQEAQRLRRQRRPVENSVGLVNLATGEKVEFPKIRRFAFSGESSGWIALYRYGPDTGGAGGGGAPAAGGGRGGRGGAGAGGAAPSTRPRGADLILRELATGSEISIGNVADFDFNRQGTFLAWTIDATDQIGNGVQIRDLRAGTVTSLDTGKAWYERLSWADKGDALAVLKGTEDRVYRDRFYSVAGFTGFGSGPPSKTSYDPAKDKTFPAGMTISSNRDPRWTEDRSALLFGIHTPRKRDPNEPAEGQGRGGRGGGAQGGEETQNEAGADEERVNLVLWHWQDKRLQSMQQVQEQRDRSFNYLAVYHVAQNRFVRLADDEVRSVDLTPGDKWALGTDEREYELMGNLDGRRYADSYAINVGTGERKLAGKRIRWSNTPSPDGTMLLFYNDGHYYTYSLPTGQTRNITELVPTSFVDTEDDHNNVKPPIRPIDWAADSKSVLLYDNWDIWQVPVGAGAAVNLTGNGKKEGIRYQRTIQVEPREPGERGVDLSKPVFVSAYGEWTKKNGIARLDPGRPGAQMVFWGDEGYGRLSKAKNADIYLYTRDTTLTPAEYYVTDSTLKPGTKITNFVAQQEPFHWSSGAMIVNYTSEKGDKLQGALYLPANYEKGKSYPTIVQIYEKLSQGMNRYAGPSANGYNRAVYTSNGYAVFNPDITYRINDPGMSAVWCVVPAVKAAIATGVVDPKRIGLHGHSWGGYQTSFLITQTDLFAAAVAGAPLTNMISMANLIYKNTGGSNEAIFESSQGRFRGGPWGENFEAYVRNSPVVFATRVKTPLVILHNDQDGAVDFTQGVEYYNVLRRLQKPVVMLEYPGENHGLRREANQRDYTVRMKEFFDHYLQGAPAPDWWKDGVPRLDMEEHLRKRATPPPTRRVTTTAGGR